MRQLGGYGGKDERGGGEANEGRDRGRGRGVDEDSVLISDFSDMRMHLQVTDYGTFLQNEPSPLQTMTVSDHRSGGCIGDGVEADL